MDVNLERLSKQLANISAAGQASRIAQHALAGPQIPSRTVWTGIQAAEQQWLLQQKHNIMPPTNAIARSLSRVPEIRLPVITEARMVGRYPRSITKREFVLCTDQ